MKPLMSSCLTSTSCVSGLTARICPVSSYCLGGGSRRPHAALSASATTHDAITARRESDMCLTLPDDLGGHVRLQLSGMEGELLSRHNVVSEDAAVLRGAIFNRRD